VGYLLKFSSQTNKMKELPICLSSRTCSAGKQPQMFKQTLQKTCIFVFELVCKCVCYVVHTWKSGHKHACVCVCNRLHTSPTAEGRGFGEGVSKGVKTNAVGNEMQCAKCIFRDYTIEVINHNGRWKSRGYTFLGVRL